MESAKINQADLLEAVKLRIIAQVPGFNNENCWVDDDPFPVSSAKYDIWCSIAPDDGRFVIPETAPCSLLESGGFLVTVAAKALEGPGDVLEHHLIKDRSRGILLNFKPRILSALLVDVDILDGATRRRRWEPRLSDGRWMLADSIQVVSVTAPRRLPAGVGASFVGIQFKVSVTFNWQL